MFLHCTFTRSYRLTKSFPHSITFSCNVFKNSILPSDGCDLNPHQTITYWVIHRKRLRDTILFVMI